MRNVLLIVLCTLLSGGVCSYPRAQSCLGSLCEWIESGSFAELHHPSFLRQRNEIRSLYAGLNYQTVWLKDGKPTARTRDIVQVLRQADAKGLDPADYDGELWDARIRAWDENSAVRFDLGLTICVARYLSDLRFGRGENAIYTTASNQGEGLLPVLLERAAHDPDLSLTLREVEPPFGGYWRALDALRRYRMISEMDDGALLPSTDTPVEPGSRYPGLAQLAYRLELLGDLKAPANIEIYESPLVEAVRHFQMRHGLLEDGRIGKATLAELNTSIRTRIRQLELTLERWRQVPHAFAKPPIIVNIPEFHLYALGASYESELEMRVVVGKAVRLETPLFRGDLKEVIFHPYWNVPLSIQRQELIPELLRDAAYVSKHDFEIVTPQGTPMTPEMTKETIANLKAGKLRLRQRPGPQNPLGSVKFVFPNAHDVYMHDTPSHALFAASRRDFSHGCIRVEDALGLAEWVLRDDPQWTRDRISSAMSGTETMSVTLRATIPVLIVYGTAVVKKNGDVHFLRDIYGQDRELEKQLASRVF